MHLILLPPALWPVLEIAPWLVGASLLGVLGQHVAQILQALDWVNLRAGKDPPGRLGGFNHPIQTGAWCVTAMCWHLAALLTKAGRLRVLSAVGIVAAAAGLVATQSRGPWLAAATVVPAALVVIAVRRPSARRPAVIMAVIGLAVVAGAWPIAGGFVRSRAEAALREYREARAGGAYETSVGLRVAQYGWAWDMFTRAPIFGLGAGGFRAALRDEPTYLEAIERAKGDPAVIDSLTRDHPHNTTLHVLATTGAIGGAFLLAVLVATLIDAVRDRPDHPYADGALFVVIAWMIGAQFDAYHLSGQYLGILMAAIGLTLPSRDRVVGTEEGMRDTG
jgi:O-antigen ligase